MSTEEKQSVDDALVPRLHVIEDQSLDARAAAYVQLHEELRARLEGLDGLKPNA